MSRESQTDNRKHGPATTKAQASTVAQWPTCMGAWDAPGQTLVTDNEFDIDDAIEANANTGTQNYNPINGQMHG
jgi:hypothetical protein